MSSKKQKKKLIEAMELAISYCKPFMNIRGKVILNATLESELLMRKLRLLGQNEKNK
jgi:hypothetical protein